MNELMRKRRFSVSIGICARNEAAHIITLLDSIAEQIEDEIKISEIVIVSDGSRDRTERLVRAYKDSRIKLVRFSKRAGKAVCINHLLKSFRGRALIILDADSKIATPTSLQALVRPMMRNKEVGMVAGRCLPFEPKTFIEGAVSSYVQARIAVEHLFEFNQTTHSLKGTMMAISKQFAQQVSLPDDVILDDDYLYFSAQMRNFEIIYAKQAQTYYRSPQTLHQEIRALVKEYNGTKQLYKYFPPYLLEKGLKLPFWLTSRIIFFQIISNPFGYATVTFLTQYVHVKLRQNKSPRIILPRLKAYWIMVDQEYKKAVLK